MASLIGALGSLGSSAIGMIAGGHGQYRTYKYNRALQEQQYAFNQNLQNSANAFAERMSNTAHQREIADLRRSGLNPILSATGGNGAPSFSSASASVSGTSVPGMDTSSANDVLGKALAFRQQKNQDRQTDSNIELQDEQGKLAKQQAKGAVWDALTKQQYYDEVVPLQMEQIKLDMQNSIANTAANVRYLNNLGASSLIRAEAESSQANTARNMYEMNKGLHDKDIEFYKKHPKATEIGKFINTITGGSSLGNFVKSR